MVAVEPVLDTTVFQVVPPSVDLSILYPVIAEPPLFVGAVQLRLICDGETAVAERFVGADGTVVLEELPFITATELPELSTYIMLVFGFAAAPIEPAPTGTVLTALLVEPSIFITP